ncbi:isochorismatase family protein [Paraburkholderia sp. DGU8]|uniref:isochorismatase family protein n=1 Tax=Paraburkholderia sp. DGU8 TaxID=3161997 RepID=UPI0034674D1A
MIPELAAVLATRQVIERTTVNAWEEPRVVLAVQATGRKHIIVTGVSTDVCLALPAPAALRDGYTSYAVVDASGSFTQTQVDLGVARMVQAGVIPVGYSTASAELLSDNAAPEAQAVYEGLNIPFSNMVFGLKQYWHL